ncbi:MAG: TIGR03364 family FAD-dependent oxidoreductase [Corynebacterium sp.]|uniref:TIGR03364 family FAD-dependent oxidoreductase n=1 Tax=Corynebacterium sp. TaxID=1720 RepID=UPI0026DC9A0D|nr:TIGR03364 family FAD-dependent oxidoreductase [Corynebacterium sp.]MDO5028978.1 TIGR03364 family FAD-dependent oxidoreductase [Corynebacterium sp.]
MQSDMHTDLIVVGAGILGLATAFRARQQGLSVRVIDRAERPVGSSIMNFGHACFTGQADVIQDVAMSSRSGWAAAADKTGLWAATSGTYIPAVTETEMQLLEEFADHRGSAQVKLLTNTEVANAIGNPDLDCVGGAHLPLDMRVNPREAAPRLAKWLEEHGVIFNWRHEVKAVAGGRVGTNRGNFQAERVICCPNFWLTNLFPQLADEHEVRVCTLHMALIERPTNIPKDIALFTGTSLARYDGFTSLPSAAALKEELTQNSPELVNCVANVMSTGIDEGLFIGDSHAYDLSPDPFLEEKTSNLLLDTACDYFGITQPKVIQRWQGRYSDSTKTNLILEQPDSQTTVAVVTSGIGMTLSFGIAELALQGAKPAELADF